MRKQFGWLDYVTLGVQMHQAQQQAGMQQQLAAQTELMQLETQKREQVIQARQFMVQCEDSLQKSETSWNRFPYYAIWRLEKMGSFLRTNNLQSVFTEIDDMRIAIDLQKKIDEKLSEYHSKTPKSEAILGEISDSIFRMSYLEGPLSCVMKNRELQQIEPQIEERRQEINEWNKQLRILPTVVILLLFSSYITGWFPQTHRGESEYNNCEINEMNGVIFNCDLVDDGFLLGDTLSWDSGLGDYWTSSSYDEISSHGTFWVLWRSVYNFEDGSETRVDYVYGAESISENGIASSGQLGGCWPPLYDSRPFWGDGFSGGGMFPRTDEYRAGICDSTTIVLVPPELTVILLSAITYFLVTRGLYLKLDPENEQQMEELASNRKKISETVSSVDAIHDEEAIVTVYNESGNFISQYFPSEERDFF